MSISSLPAAPEDSLRAGRRWSLLWISSRAFHRPPNPPLLPPLWVWTQLWQHWRHSRCPALHGQVLFFTHSDKAQTVFTFTALSRRFCPKRLTISLFVTRKRHAMQVEVKSEQMSLEAYAADGRWFRCPDIGQDFGLRFIHLLDTMMQMCSFSQGDLR